MRTYKIKRGAYTITGTKIPGAPEELIDGLNIEQRYTLDVVEVAALVTDLTDWIASTKS